MCVCMRVCARVWCVPGAPVLILNERGTEAAPGFWSPQVLGLRLACTETPQERGQQVLSQEEQDASQLA